MRSQVPVRVSLLTAVVALAMVLIVATPDAQTPEAQAEAANTKLQAVIQHAGAPRAARRTIFMDGELNAYLKYRATWLPEGITNAAVTFVSDSRVATSLIADLDRVRRKSSGGWFDPTSYLKGRLPVTVVGTLTTSSGRGTFGTGDGHGGRYPSPGGLHPGTLRVLHAVRGTARRRQTR